jgi:hypothetical protein
MPEIEDFTSIYCKNGSARANSRISELRTIHKYEIDNKKEGNKSLYRLSISEPELNTLRKEWVNDKNTIQDYHQIKEKTRQRGIQIDVFPGVVRV